MCGCVIALKPISIKKGKTLSIGDTNFSVFFFRAQIQTRTHTGKLTCSLNLITPNKC